MNWFHHEPTLHDILSDSIIQALMEADGVDPQELAATLRQTGLKLVRLRHRVRRGIQTPHRRDTRSAVEMIAALPTFCRDTSTTGRH